MERPGWYRHLRSDHQCRTGLRYQR